LAEKWGQSVEKARDWLENEEGDFLGKEKGEKIWGETV
jgi:hypothetical protein